MSNPRETATILAALHFWREEMCPHDTSVMRPYFSDLELGHMEPLETDEIVQLMRRLRANVSNHGLGDSSTTSGPMDG